ncbi:MAG: hypothetical protein AB8A35_08685 [Prochlorococcus sp.]|nr:hypothetical protein [Prochlorococcaceae cyanobacterium ETNP2_MAG_10]
MCNLSPQKKPIREEATDPNAVRALQITAVLHQIGSSGCDSFGILTSFPIASLMVSFLNNVRVIVKEGCEEQYLAAVEAWTCPEGMTDHYLAKTGEHRYCFVGLWES